MMTRWTALSTASFGLLVVLASAVGCRADRERKVLGGVNLDATVAYNLRSSWTPHVSRACVGSLISSWSQRAT